MREQSKPSWGERGNFSLLAGLSLVVLLGFGALVIDVGVLYWTKSRGQDAAQAAALAAVKDLNGTPSGLDAACKTAKSMIDQNSLNAGEYGLSLSCTSPFSANNDVVFGIWSEDAQTFTPGSNSSVLAINSVRVNLKRTEAKGNGIAPMLASVFTVFGAKIPKQLDVNTSATAATVVGGPASAAGGIFPLAALEDSFLKPNGDVACGREVILGANVSCTKNPSDCLKDSGVTERFNWTLGGSDDNFGTNDLRDAADQAIKCLEGDTEACEKNSFAVGDVIGIKAGGHNGFFNSSNSPFAQYMATHTSLKVQIPVFDQDSNHCGGDPDRGHVVGVGTLNIVEYKSTGSSKFIRAIVVCEQETAAPGNTNLPDFGTEGKGRTALVQ
jgi:Flp pilus assembly protein TadG